jgi:hypothetical protein
MNSFKSYLLFVCIAVLAGCGSGGDSGSGNSCNCIEITTAQGLQAMNNKLSGVYVLKNNITLDSTTNFTPIGTSSTPFTGSFDGQGYKISGLKINTPSANFVGLFGATQGGAIKNFTIDHVGITGQQYVGAITGQLIWGTISDVTVMSTTNSPVTGVDYVGGAVGHIPSNTTLNAQVSSPVVGTGTGHAGGLVGWLASNGTVVGAMTGSVTGSSSGHVGGLVGEISSNGTAVGYATGAVTSTGSGYTGGLVGNLAGNGRALGYSVGAINGKSWTGGLVGFIQSNGTVVGFSNGIVASSASNSAHAIGKTAWSTPIGYWDFAKTPSTTETNLNLIGVSATANIVCSASACTDTKGTVSAADDVTIFNESSTFTTYFQAPTQNAKWPKLKQDVVVSGSGTYSLSSAVYGNQTSVLGW